MYAPIHRYDTSPLHVEKILVKVHQLEWTFDNKPFGEATFEHGNLGFLPTGKEDSFIFWWHITTDQIQIVKNWQKFQGGVFQIWFFGCSPRTLGKIPILTNLFKQIAATTTKHPITRSLGQACRVADGGEQNTTKQQV